jgi:uncharacterized protein (DUF305 family)
MRSLPLRAAAALLAAAALVSTGAARASAQPGRAAPPDPVARARADSARLPYTAADVRFMSAMIGHHAQAITMGRLAPSRCALTTRSARVRTAGLAARDGARRPIVIACAWWPIMADMNRTSAAV